MVENQRKSPLYLITGLILGLLLGIFYGWVINPTRYVDISPQSLLTEQKKQYMLLISQSYQANEDIGRSYARIKQMMDPVDMDQLRTMLLSMEMDNNYRDQFEVMRNFINDLDIYTQAMRTSGQTPDIPMTTPIPAETTLSP